VFSGPTGDALVPSMNEVDRQAPVLQISGSSEFSVGEAGGSDAGLGYQCRDPLRQSRPGSRTSRRWHRLASPHPFATRPDSLRMSPSLASPSAASVLGKRSVPYLRRFSPPSDLGRDHGRWDCTGAAFGGRPGQSRDEEVMCSGHHFRARRSESSRLRRPVQQGLMSVKPAHRVFRAGATISLEEMAR